MTLRLSHPLSFNEAGGFLPRKLAVRNGSELWGRAASMRPGDFSPGNCIQPGQVAALSGAASMRPGDFSPGNHPLLAADRARARRASMRPGDFSPGNARTWYGVMLADQTLQ